MTQCKPLHPSFECIFRRTLELAEPLSGFVLNLVPHLRGIEIVLHRMQLCVDCPAKTRSNLGDQVHERGLFAKLRLRDQPFR